MCMQLSASTPLQSLHGIAVALHSSRAALADARCSGTTFLGVWSHTQSLSSAMLLHVRCCVKEAMTAACSLPHVLQCLCRYQSSIGDGELMHFFDRAHTSVNALPAPAPKHELPPTVVSIKEANIESQPPSAPSMNSSNVAHFNPNILCPYNCMLSAMQVSSRMSILSC